MLARIATTLVGVLLIIYGFIAVVSPLPLGFVMVPLGLIMIAGANPAARPLILRMRRKWRWFDGLVRKAAHHSPPRFRETIAKTDPALHAPDAETNKEG